MNSYTRDDGIVMVETRPGCFTRRDSLSLLDLAPLASRPGPAADLPRTSIEPPPLAPTHEDLASAPVEATAPSPATSTIPMPAPGTVAVAARAPRPKPAKRSIAAILAEAGRNQRSRRTGR